MTLDSGILTVCKLKNTAAAGQMPVMQLAQQSTHYYGERTVGYNRQYFRPNLQPPFCIWAEESGSSFTADNKTVEHALTGTVDYFSKQEYDPAPDAIESTLSGLGFIWELNSVQYEDETELIHHEWTWSMR